VGNAFGTPEEAITPRKLREVIQTATYYAAFHPALPQALRVDVVGIVLEAKTSKVLSLTHTPNVSS